MSIVSRARTRLRLLLHRREMERRADEEFRAHIEMETEDLIRSGVSPAQARRMAMRDFGGVTQTRETWRATRPLAWLDGVMRDAALAFRALRRDTGFSAAVILICGLGIGATAAMFSIAYAVVLAPLPFPEPDRLYSVQMRHEDGNAGGLAGEAFGAVTGAPNILEAAARYTVAVAVLGTDNQPERVRAERATPDMFRLLGAAPLHGRVFDTDEARTNAPVAILGHSLWTNRFGGDTTLIGRTIHLDGRPTLVVGVMRPDFAGPRSWLVVPPALWTPLDPGRPTISSSTIVRLRRGVSPEAAEQWMASAVPARALNVTGTDSVAVRPELVSLSELAAGGMERPLAILLGAVTLVLVLVVLNVATLMLARGAAREHEFSIRAALGASRWRQVRRVLTETMILSLAAGALGAVLATLSISAVRTFGVDILPRVAQISLDAPTLLLLAFVTCVCGIAMGIVPALASARADIRSGLVGRSRLTNRPVRWGGVRGGFVAAEVALSVALLVGAGLMLKGFLTVLPSQPGFAVEGRVRIPVWLIASRPGSMSMEHPYYSDSLAGDARRLDFVDAVRRELATVPGVMSAEASSFVPLVRETAVIEVLPDSGASDGGTRRTAHHRAVTPDYLRVMGMEVVEGRGFGDSDKRGSPPVVIVNQEATRRWWPGGSAVGRFVTFTNGRDGRVTAQIVGVVRDARMSGVDTRARPEFFVPIAHAPPQILNFVALMDPSAPIDQRAIRAAVWRVDPTLPIDDIESMSTIAGEAVALPRFYAFVSGVFAIIAVVLAGAGLHSVLAYAVAQRTREIGLRMALGARRGSVIRMVVRQGGLMAGIGLVIGIAVALGFGRVLGAVLFEVRATDPFVFGAVAVLTAIVAVSASVAPVVRAVRVDPLIAIKAE